VIGSLALIGDGDAATAAGTATATVLESVSVSISAPPTPVPAGVGTISILSGTIFTPESFMGSLSLSGPLLRFGSNPPPGFRVAAVPSTVDGATVNVTCNADGSLRVSGGPGLTFAVSRPGVCVVNIEYN
jgi:hypothetical protein